MPPSQHLSSLRSTGVRLTLTVEVGSAPALLRDSVFLYHLRPTGQVLLGRMYDDGTNGDSKAGDNIFTTQLPLTYSGPPGVTALKATAAYSGVLRRSESPTRVLIIASATTAESMLSQLANALENGNTSAILKFFVDNPQNTDRISRLTPAAKYTFAAILRSATFSEGDNRYRIYKATTKNAKDSSPLEVTFYLTRSEAGEWVIDSW